MNILLLSDGITPFVKGGMQRHSQLMAENLALLGHKITIYHYLENDTKESSKEIAFSAEAYINIDLVTFKYLDRGRLPGHYLRAQKEMSLQYLNHLVNSGKSYDFIYTKGFMGWALLAKREVYGINTPIAVKFHGMNMYQPQASFKLELQKYLLRPAVKKIMQQADFVFSYGGKITDIIRENSDTPVLEVPTGIDDAWIASQLPIRSGKLKFLFVGRFDRVKGLPELYQALEELAKKFQNWECHFVGPIPEAHQLKLAQCIYHGAVYDQEVLRSHYDHCDILLNTSISEGMPNVILEAMARGQMIVATDVGATSVLVKHNVNGLLIAKANSKLILEALLPLCELDRNALASFQNQSLRMVIQMTWKQIAPRLAETIQACIKV